MREIEFRGRDECGRWAYGDLAHKDGFIFIDGICVDRETVGQDTEFQAIDSNRYIAWGPEDVKDFRIFEGDIVNIRTPEFLPQKVPDDGPFVINWEQFSCSFMVFDKKSGGLVPISWFNGDLDKLNIEIIGNLRDNPELLSQE